MTVIATVISKFCTVHASDSLVTKKLTNGNHEITNEEAPKIIKIRRWSGAMSFFGIAAIGTSWTLSDFLQEQATMANNCCGPEDFADLVSESLNRIPAVNNYGVGIHFTAYEVCEGSPIPELFQITNYLNTQYSQIDARGVTVRRETYAKVAASIGDKSPRSEHGKAEYRLRVRDYLEEGNIYIYNNGDPILFNLASNGVFNMISVAADRGNLRPLHDAAEHRKLASLPVKLVINLQSNFFLPNRQIVGGALHNLSITPEGEYDSDTGDD